MKKLLFSLLLLSLGLIGFTYAHPGNTDAFGYHTCYTNCASWGYADGQYHNHPDSIKTPTSYASYAPAGSCREEKEETNNALAEVKKIEQDILNIERNIRAEYEGIAFSEAYVRAKIDRTKKLLVDEYNFKYTVYSTSFDSINVCLEYEGYINYLKMKEEAELKTKQWIELLSPVPTQLSKDTINNEKVTNKEAIAINSLFKSSYKNLSNQGKIKKYNTLLDILLAASKKSLNPKQTDLVKGLMVLFAQEVNSLSN